MAKIDGDGYGKRWEYRLVSHYDQVMDDGQRHLVMHEVTFDEAGENVEMDMIGEVPPAVVMGQTVEGVRRVLELMQQALIAPASETTPPVISNLS